jgi:hypothetical protein
MKKCLDMSMDAGQEHAIQTFDQQLYAIAQQVKWSRPVIFEPCILKLGGFHSLFTFIFALGKLWADGGLRSIDISRHFFIAVGTVDMSVGFASIIGGYARTVTSSLFFQ